MPKMLLEILKATIYSLIICSIVVFSLSFILDKIWGKIFIQLLCTVISGSLLYSFMWYEGDREKNFVQFGRMEEDKNWGLKVGLVGMLLPMATLVLVIFAKALNMPDLIVYYKLINPQINMLINLFIPTVDPSSFGVLQIILTALLYLYVPVFCAVGYRLGYRRFSLMEKLVYDKKKDDGENGGKKPQKRSHR